LWVYTVRITALEPIINYNATSIADKIAVKLSAEVLTGFTGRVIEAVSQIEL